MSTVIYKSSDRREEATNVKFGGGEVKKTKSWPRGHVPYSCGSVTDVRWPRLRDPEVGQLLLVPDRG